MFSPNCWNSSTVVLDRRVDGAAAQALVRQAVNEKAVEVFAQAVDHGIVAFSKSTPMTLTAPVLNCIRSNTLRPFRGRLLICVEADCGRELGIFGVDVRCFASDLDHFRSLADLQLKVHVRDGAGVHVTPLLVRVVLKPVASTVIL